MSSGIKPSLLFAFGLLASNVLPTLASAIPSANADVISVKSKFDFQGTYYDGGSEKWFDLYSPAESAMTREDALNSYWYNFANTTTSTTTSLAKRSFYNCDYNSGWKVAGCGTAHGIGAFVIATGGAVAGSYIRTIIDEAFTSGRDNQNPRSICITKDNDTVCGSWAEYNTETLPGSLDNLMANFAVSCAQDNNGSSEFKVTLNGGQTCYFCVSNRATGCGESVCGQ